MALSHFDRPHDRLQTEYPRASVEEPRWQAPGREVAHRTGQFVGAEATSLLRGAQRLSQGSAEAAAGRGAGLRAVLGRSARATAPPGACHRGSSTLKKSLLGCFASRKMWGCGSSTQTRW